MAVIMPLPDVESPGVLVNNHQHVETLQRAIISAPRDIILLRSLIIRVIRDNAWIDRFDPDRGARFVYSPDEFIRFIRDPLPQGLGTDEATIRRFLEDNTAERIAFEQAIARGPGGANNPDGKNQHTEQNPVNVSIGNIDHNADESHERLSPVGNMIGYAIRKLSKDRPDLLEKVKAGELSAHRAMIHAGFRKEKTTTEQLMFWWNKAKPEERAAFLEQLKNDVLR